MARMAREAKPVQHCVDRNLGRTAEMAIASSLEHRVRSGKMSLSTTPAITAASRVISRLRTTSQAVMRTKTTIIGGWAAQ